MKKKLLIATFFLTTSVVFAECFGTGSFKECYDDNGNTYTVEKYGSTTYVNGSNSNTGSTWSEEAQTYGNTTYINGTAANGNSWDETIERYGETTYISGTDKDGDSFSKTCFGDECY